MSRCNPKRMKVKLQLTGFADDKLVNGLWYLAFGLSLVGICLNVILFGLAQRREANTTRAIQTMREFHSAQVVFSTCPTKGNFAATESDFYLLRPEDGSGFISEPLIKMQRIPCNGYIMASIKTTPKAPDHGPTYSIVVVPEVQTGLFRTGDDCFYVDQTGEIRHSGSPTIMPDANSPLLQP